MEQPGSRQPAPPPLDLIQDLANSFDLESGRESLVSPRDMDAFARAHGMHGTRFSSAELHDVRQFRDALRECCIAHAGHTPDPAQLSFLNDVLARVPMNVRVAPDAEPTLEAATPGTHLDALVARVQDAIYRAQVQDSWTRLKACESETCRWVYYDNSPSGRSRWCTMSVCGSRAKMRAYRARKGTSQSESPP
ncbi:CGNR zinc finger domain-containing protein [Microbacterium sp. SORGH_AS_0888]|uniref:CGNR zinc finger domain-containing protein n=1 Tax=Microbacterium sp. SORGH_AS_0888 TaxID=3041791 RepID=UPI002780C08D|nr:CGNR zinc finger domain-containing protein [Microbacterium sp. SORGH_AS_0888]MDQ1130688.1 putative RNA-binding Zn ribbon-like protein [Microbacterium sp. SORGH_AS_0888]